MMNSIPRIRHEWIGRFVSLGPTGARALGAGFDCFGGWVNGVGEGLAFAIARQGRWDSERGVFLHLALVQNGSLSRKELRRRRLVRSGDSSKNIFQESVRNSDLRGYTCSEGVGE